MEEYDLIVIGGGLAGGLAAYRCRERAPALRILLIERADRLGGNRTWSFHGPDVDPEALRWLQPFIGGAWPTQTVRFPAFEREVPTPYFSLRSTRFHEVVARSLGESLWLSTEGILLDPHQIQIPDRGIVRAKKILDARGIEGNWGHRVAYQKFLGQDLLLKRPHGLTAPILMDATVPQEDGYRFFYVLPWTENRLLVEDTRYSESPELSVATLRERVAQYALRSGWDVEAVEREEVGCLPIPFSRHLPWESGRSALGVRAGLFHPTTGYSLPDAVRAADCLALQAEQGRFWSDRRWARHCRRQVAQRGFYRMLNRMLISTVAERRFEWLQRFYRLPVYFIRRFYAGTLRSWEYPFVILWGKPPTGIGRLLNPFQARKQYV